MFTFPTGLCSFSHAHRGGAQKPPLGRETVMRVGIIMSMQLSKQAPHTPTSPFVTISSENHKDQSWTL